MEEVSQADAGGLAHAVHRALLNDFSAEVAGGADLEALIGPLLAQMRAYFTLEDEGEGIEDACDTLREAVYDHGSDQQLLYADLLAAICCRKLRNASRRLVPAHSGISIADWRNAILKPGFPIELWPGQRLICESGLLQGASAVIQMPTSAGKTRATELMIRSAFLSGRTALCVIVAPFRSLCHDIRADLSHAFTGEPIALNEPTDSFQLDVTFGELADALTVLIVTPEKLLYMLRRTPELIERMGLVIYDEGHQFDGMTRGPTYELLLSSLKLARPPDAQTVLISAVIGNAGSVAAWLFGEEGAVVSGTNLLPTTKSVAFASWELPLGQLRYVAPTAPDDDEFFVPRIINQTNLQLRPKERTARAFPEKEGPDVGLYLGLQLVQNGAVAVFCGLKSSASGVCKRVVELVERAAPINLPIEFSDAEEIGRIAALAREQLGEESPIAMAAGLGVLAHHGEIPHGLRLSVEYAMKESLARFVVCTSTLAQGVNFPIKYLIVTATQQGRDPILVRDFHNLMGRAGRAGMHTEGSVIFAAPTIYDQRKGVGEWRWRGAKKLLDPGNTEPTRSSILGLFRPFEQTQPPITMEIPAEWLDLTFATAETFQTIYLAALAIDANISEKEFKWFIGQRARVIQNIASYLSANMTFDDEESVDRVRDLAAHTLAYHLADEGTRARLLGVFTNIATALRQNANSAQRSLIRRSPLPPSAVFDLEKWVEDGLTGLRAAFADGSILDHLTPKVLSLISDSKLRSLSDPDVIPTLWAMWRDGNSFGTIKDFLAESKIKMGRSWVDAEDAVAICEGGFGFDLAMVLASLADLLEERDDDLHEFVSSLQRATKVGLNDMSAIAFYEAGFADRSVALTLGQHFAANTRAEVRTVCRRQLDAVNGALAPYPTYFQAVARELNEA